MFLDKSPSSQRDRWIRWVSAPAECYGLNSILSISIPTGTLTDSQKTHHLVSLYFFPELFCMMWPTLFLAYISSFLKWEFWKESVNCSLERRMKSLLESSIVSSHYSAAILRSHLKCLRGPHLIYQGIRTNSVQTGNVYHDAGHLPQEPKRLLWIMGMQSYWFAPHYNRLINGPNKLRL